MHLGTLNIATVPLAFDEDITTVTPSNVFTVVNVVIVVDMVTVYFARFVPK